MPKSESKAAEKKKRGALPLGEVYRRGTLF